MLSVSTIKTSTAKVSYGMSEPKKLPPKALQAEWEEIQAAQGNPALFRPLYDRYYEAIFRFIFRRTHEESLSADICSQVFLKALQKLKSYQFKGVPFSAWLYRIASNEVTQHFRKSSKNRVVSVEEGRIADIADEIESKDNAEFREAMIKSLDDLSDKDLEVIELRFFEQRPFKEVAGILGITESNAKVKTYRILAKLKKHILRKTG